MFTIAAASGEEILIPSSFNEDFSYFAPEQTEDAIKYYHANGYVVIRGLVSAEKCDLARQEFTASVKPYEGYLYRQTGGNPERNRFNDRGHLMNPILNLQDVPLDGLSEFRESCLNVLTDKEVQSFLNTLYEQPAKLTQSMYFEGNSETWAHQDTYYLDSEKIGSLIAGWYALEDIQPGAGRFFIYPKSHLIDVRKNGGDFDVAFNHSKYKKLILELIRKFGLECRAPALRKGDVLFWNSKTIHGSLQTKQPEYSRSSLTAHYIPESHKYLQFQARILPLNLLSYNGIDVHHPKTLQLFKNRCILFFETRFPKVFQALKWTAVKLLVTR
jgi:phytanoyl-CoA hydroxylase